MKKLVLTALLCATVGSAFGAAGGGDTVKVVNSTGETILMSVTMKIGGQPKIITSSPIEAGSTKDFSLPRGAVDVKPQIRLAGGGGQHKFTFPEDYTMKPGDKILLKKDLVLNVIDKNGNIIWPTGSRRGARAA